MRAARGRAAAVIVVHGIDATIQTNLGRAGLLAAARALKPV